MSNFKKAFSFRNGVQVDTDNFVVTTAGLVGIGTTVPTEYFHVLGNAKFEDNINIGSVEVNGIGTFGQVKVGSAITISGDSGIITATAFYGDGATLSNLPTSQWLDIDPGLGFTSIYAQGNVGVGTDDPTGNYVFQVGSDPSTDDNLPGVGIASDGNAHFSGIITATNGILAGGNSTLESVIIDGDGSTGINAPFIIGNSKIRVRSDVGNLYSQGSITLGVNYPSTSTGVVLNPNGTSQFNGPVTIDSTATVTGFTTTGTFYSAGISTFGDSVEIGDRLSVSGITTFNSSVEFVPTGLAANKTMTWDPTNGHLVFADDSKIVLGDAFSIRHDSIPNETYFAGYGVRPVNIGGTPVKIQNPLFSKTSAQFNADSAVELYYNNSKKLETTSEGVDVYDRLNVAGVTSTSSLTADTSVGIGTTLPQSTLQVEAENNARLDVITTDPNFPATVSIGTAVSGNERGALVYSDSILSINNYDTGGIRINMNEGTNNTTQENFAVVLDNQEILSVSGDRKVGINKALPEKALDVTGELLVTGNAKIVGVCTFGEGANIFTFGDGSPLPIPDTQNFNTISGISTFNALDAIENVSIGNTLTVGADIYVYNNEPGASLSYVGIRTDSTTVTSVDYALAVFGDSHFHEGASVRDHFYLTDDGAQIQDPRPDIPEPANSIAPFLDFGSYQVESNAMSFIGTQLMIVPNRVNPAPAYGGVDYGVEFDDPDDTKFLTVVGINTVFPRSILDVGAASTTISSYFIPPSMPQATIDIVTELWDPNGTETANPGHVEAKKKTPNGIVPGAIIYNETANELEVGIGPKQFAPLGVPLGGIIMWSGTIGNIPDGYKLCDGTNGTPNLRDRFIVGAGDSYSVNDTVGIGTTSTVPIEAYALAYIMRTNS
jgi:hypothetical protein